MTKYKYQRCITCDRILTEKMISKGVCVGHKTKYLISGSLFEFLMIKLGLFWIYEDWTIKKYGEIR